VKNIGIIGCGSIFDVYVNASKMFSTLNYVSCADIIYNRAKEKAHQHNLKLQTIEDIFQDESIDIILNLTNPVNHLEVSYKALENGKHVYSEKPIGVNVKESKELLSYANKKNLHIGCAPDTFLGGGHQLTRQLVDNNFIGTPLACTAFCQSPGPKWNHPNPDSYYIQSGGPLYDMGPYYLTCLVNLLGPMKKVYSIASKFSTERAVTYGPRFGEKINVDTFTHISGIAEFVSGPILNINMSFEVWNHKHNHLELYGTEGSLLLGDPNVFWCKPELFKPTKEEQLIRKTDREDFEILEHKFSYAEKKVNYRGLGLVDMIYNMEQNLPHRANASLAIHVLDAIESLTKSAYENQPIELTTTTNRPSIRNNEY